MGGGFYCKAIAIQSCPKLINAPVMSLIAWRQSRHPAPRDLERSCENASGTVALSSGTVALSLELEHSVCPQRHA